MAEEGTISSEEAQTLLLQVDAKMNDGVVHIGELEVPADTSDIALEITDGADINFLPGAEETHYLLNGKLYDVLKWVAIIALPAFSWFYQTVGSVWNLPYVEQVTYTLAALGSLIAILIGASALSNKVVTKS